MRRAVESIGATVPMTKHSPLAERASERRRKKTWQSQGASDRRGAGSDGPETASAGSANPLPQPFVYRRFSHNYYAKRETDVVPLKPNSQDNEKTFLKRISNFMFCWHFVNRFCR